MADVVDHGRDKWRVALLGRAELAALRARCSDAGRRIVLCHGCFDLLHPGHIRHFRFAKAQGDVLVVSISSDRWVEKGDDRPYLSQELRAEHLAALEMVDHVTISDEAGAGQVIAALRPDVYAKGIEAEPVTDGGFGEDRRAVESHGGQMAFGPSDVIRSSSHLITHERTEALDRELLPQRLRTLLDQHGSRPEALMGVLEDARGRPIVVIGDVTWVQHRHGRLVGRVPEVDAPSVQVDRVDEEVGCAAAVARYARDLGAMAHLVSWCGQDGGGAAVRRLLDIPATWIDVGDRETPAKHRTYAGDSVVFEQTNIDCAPLAAAAGGRLVEAVDLALQTSGASVVVVVDFGFGGITEQVHDAVGRWRSEGVHVLADVQQGTCEPELPALGEAHLMSPNEREVRAALGMEDAPIEALVSGVLAATRCDWVLMTRGPRGALLQTRAAEAAGEAAIRLPTLALHVVDSSGAGDASLAMLALTQDSDASPVQRAVLAAAASAAACLRIGNAPITPGDVAAALAQGPAPVTYESLDA